MSEKTQNLSEEMFFHATHRSAVDAQRDPVQFIGEGVLGGGVDLKFYQEVRVSFRDNAGLVFYGTHECNQPCYIGLARYISNTKPDGVEQKVVLYKSDKSTFVCNSDDFYREYVPNFIFDVHEKLVWMADERNWARCDDGGFHLLGDGLPWKTVAEVIDKLKELHVNSDLVAHQAASIVTLIGHYSNADNWLGCYDNKSAYLFQRSVEPWMRFQEAVVSLKEYVNLIYLQNLL